MAVHNFDKLVYLFILKSAKEPDFVGATLLMVSYCELWVLKQYFDIDG